MSRFATSRVLGPTVSLNWRLRLAWAGVGLACLSVLVLAVLLKPDERGYGTHEALGMPPCGFIVTTGLPCPTCGMTTAFSCIMHGRPIEAFMAQPAGVMFCMAAMLLGVVGAGVAITGRSPRVRWERINPVVFMLTVGGVIIGGWAFKLAHGMLTGTLPAR